MELDYKPSDDFIVDNLLPLDEFDVTGSKELWLIQCPISHFREIDGKELKVKLDKDGILGGFEDSSGKEVSLVNFASQDADATVIIPCGEESKIVGKISRRVALARYPEPKELLETMKAKTQQKLIVGLKNRPGNFSKQIQNSRHKSGQSSLPHPAATRSSRQKTDMLSGLTEANPMSSKRKHRISTTAVSDSSDQSGKSKKKMKIEK